MCAGAAGNAQGGDRMGTRSPDPVCRVGMRATLMRGLSYVPLKQLTLLHGRVWRDADIPKT